METDRSQWSVEWQSVVSAAVSDCRGCGRVSTRCEPSLALSWAHIVVGLTHSLLRFQVQWNPNQITTNLFILQMLTFNVKLLLSWITCKEANNILSNSSHRPSKGESRADSTRSEGRCLWIVIALHVQWMAVNGTQMPMSFALFSKELLRYYQSLLSLLTHIRLIQLNVRQLFVKCVPIFSAQRWHR